MFGKKEKPTYSKRLVIEKMQKDILQLESDIETSKRLADNYHTHILIAKEKIISLKNHIELLSKED